MSMLLFCGGRMLPRPCAGWVAALCLLLTSSVVAKEWNQKFELGFTPFLPVRAMMQHYEPMRAYLEAQLQEPVTLVTAMDYQTFNERMRGYEYAFVVTVANSAYLANTEYGYVPMLRPAIPTRPVLITAKHSKIKNIKGLRGANLALPERLAVVSMQGLQMLNDAGMQPVRDVQVIYTPNHTAAANFVVSGEANAAIVSDRALLQMPSATRNAIRVLQTWDAGAVPGIVFLASPHVTPERVARMTQAIIEFVRQTEPGRGFIKNLGYGDLIPASVEDLAPLAPYGAQLKAALGHAR